MEYIKTNTNLFYLLGDINVSMMIIRQLHSNNNHHHHNNNFTLMFFSSCNFYVPSSNIVIPVLPFLFFPAPFFSPKSCETTMLVINFLIPFISLSTLSLPPPAPCHPGQGSSFLWLSYAFGPSVFCLWADSR